jgi:hypothetical protein
MRKARNYPSLTKRTYRPEIEQCPGCGSRLRRYGTLSRRTVITLEGVIRVTHCGYRCPNSSCATRERSYRSARADGLALPGFTFGLDMVVLVGQLRLGQHQTQDEIHQYLQERLAPFEVTISRREVLYLFDAYCTLLRAAEHLATDAAWHAQVRAAGGLLLSIDGIQPDKGNETVYLVRDVLSGRLLAAENVRLSDTPTIKQLLQPIHDLGLPVVGAISDAQLSLLGAIAELWPDIPHQVCHFHYLREASRPMYDLDRGARKQIRKAIQQPVRQVRQQIEQHLKKEQSTETTDATAVAQLHILNDYALAIQTVLNLDGQQPFRYPALAADEALSEIATSLAELEKGALRPTAWCGSNGTDCAS